MTFRRSWSTLGSPGNTQSAKPPVKLTFGIVTANALGATLYLTFAILARGLSHGKPEPLFFSRSLWLLYLFLIIDVVWGSVMLVAARWRRWDLYAFVCIGWLVAIWLGSGLASI
jgi:hypothetical protein